MIRLKNPYAENTGHNCFGCSPNNPGGLQMTFYEDGEEVVSTWSPGSQFQGFMDVLHGGIQSTVMDEIASWVVFIKLDTTGVTFRLTTRYKAPVRISKGAITLRAKLVEQRRNIASIEVVLLDGDGDRCSESMVDYFVFSRDRAEKEFHFPGKEAFY